MALMVGGDRSFERAASNDVQYLIPSRVFSVLYPMVASPTHLGFRYFDHLTPMQLPRSLDILFFFFPLGGG